MGPGAQGKRSKQENEEAKALSTSENQLGEHVGFVIQSAYQDRTWNVCHLGRTKTPFAQVLGEALADR